MFCMGYNVSATHIQFDVMSLPYTVRRACVYMRVRACARAFTYMHRHCNQDNTEK